MEDNFIGNQKAVLELLPHLVEWQTRRRYPLRVRSDAESREERADGRLMRGGLRHRVLWHRDA